MPARPTPLPLIVVVAAALAAAAAGWWLLSDGGDGAPPGEVRVATPGPTTDDGGSRLPAAPSPPEAAAPSPERRAEVEAMRPRLGPSAVIGRVLDADSGAPVPAFIVDVLPHDDADPLARVAADLERRGRAFRDSRGMFEWAADPGRWDVVVRASGYEPAVLIDHVLPALDARPVPVRLVPRPGIAGTLRDELGSPVPDATLFLEVEVASGGAAPERTVARTDEQGRYRFPDLQPGIYGVVPLEPGNALDRVGGVAVTERGSTPLDITLAPRARVVIHVEGPGGQPLGGAVVRLQPRTPGDPRRDGRTGTDGQAAFDLVLPGLYELHVTRGEFDPVDERIEVFVGAGRVEHWVRLTRAGEG